MEIQISELAATITVFLAPFTPYLVEGGKKFAGEAGKESWKIAKGVYQKIKSRWQNDKAIDEAFITVSSEPDNESLQLQLIKLLTKNLEEDINFTNELIPLIGGKETIQKIIVKRKSFIENASQIIQNGQGKQILIAEDDSKISNIKQNIK